MFGAIHNLRKLCKLGRLDEALQAAEFINQRGILGMSRDDIYCLLQGCSEKQDLAAVMRVHSLMVSVGLDSISVLGDHLIRLYSVCGSLLEANEVFCNVSNPTIFTWNTIISAHSKVGAGDKALELYHEMGLEDIEPDKFTISSVLKACSSVGAIGEGMIIHDQVIRSGLKVDLVVGNALIDMYAKCGNLETAHKEFDILPHRNTVSWGSIIAGYVRHGHGLTVFEIYEKMQCEGIAPDKFVFSSVLKVCGSTGAIEQGRLIHDRIIRSKLELDVVVGNSLIALYMTCGILVEGRTVFDEMPNHDVVSWGTIISGYAQHGQGLSASKLYEKMQITGLKPDRVTFLGILKACCCIGDIGWGCLIHEEIIRSGLKLDVVIGSTLVDMYAKCGSLQDARRVFDELSDRNVVTWDAMIAGYADDKCGLLAMELFEKMQQEGQRPGKVTYLRILKACDGRGAVVQGRMIHNQIISSGLESDVIVGSALMDMYAKCGSLEEAQRVFDELSNHDVVSWSVIIAACTEQGCGALALEVFKRMKQEGTKPNKVTYLCALKVCGNVRFIEKGRLLHEHASRSGFESDMMVTNMLVDMYAKCGNIEEARQVFDNLQNRDVVSWGAMIAGYAQHGCGLLVLELFGKMQQEGIKPDKFVFSGILKACGSTGAIERGRMLHDQISRGALESDVIIGNTLVDMYAKCGHVWEARKVFDTLLNHDVVSWGAVIAGHAQSGNCILAGQCLEEMKSKGKLPNDAIFTSILGACSHAGLLEEGCQYFRSMREDYHIPLHIEHYSCMIDLLGRAGQLNEAEDLVVTMPILPHVTVWTSLLSSCRTHSNLDLGRRCFGQVFQLNANDASGYVLMSNIHYDAHMLESAQKIPDLRQFATAQKTLVKI